MFVYFMHICMYIYMYICMYVCMFVYTIIYTSYIHVCVCVCVCLCMCVVYVICICTVYANFFFVLYNFSLTQLQTTPSLLRPLLLGGCLIKRTFTLKVTAAALISHLARNTFVNVRPS
jgi:hypothetical protein